MKIFFLKKNKKSLIKLEIKWLLKETSKNK